MQQKKITTLLNILQRYNGDWMLLGALLYCFIEAVRFLNWIDMSWRLDQKYIKDNVSDMLSND